MTDEDNKIKVFASDDNLKALGELLSNETSRKIIKNLMEHQMYTNEIATKLDIRVSLVIHHLRKLEEIGLLEIIDKKIKRKGGKHRFFKMNSDIFVTVNKTKKEVEEKGILKRIFRDEIKLMMIGLTILSSWFLSKQVYENDGTNYKFSSEAAPFLSIDWFYLNYETWIPIIVVSVSILLFIILKKRKKGVREQHH